MPFCTLLILTEGRTTSSRGTSGILSERDVEILKLLVRSIRVLSVAQLARTWWQTSSEPQLSAAKRMAALQSAGFVDPFEGLAHPELPLESAVAVWEPGLPSPAAGSVSYRLQSRWNLHPKPTKCVAASVTARRYFGAPVGRKPRERELTHDIHLSAVFLRVRESDPEGARFWAYEDTIVEARKSRREKLPDAIIVAPDRTKVIEFGGAYGKRKVQAFHDYCEEYSLPYEIW